MSCGTVARSQWAVIVDCATDTELPDGRVGEIWLHGDNIGRGYWGRRAGRGSHAQGCDDGALWLRTGDLGVYLDGGLYITARIKDLIIVGGRNHYPQDIEATVAEASAAVRSGFVAAFSVPGDGREEVASSPNGYPVPVKDINLVAAGVIPRTTSGKLARRACRAKPVGAATLQSRV